MTTDIPVAATASSVPVSQPTSLPATIARIAGVLAQPHYPGRDRAMLKRWSPGQPIPLAFYRLWLQHLHREPPQEADAITWMALVWGLALSGTDAHRSSRSLGQALAETRYAEARLERLLSAPNALRLDLYTSLVRFLAAKRESCHWGELAEYLLTQAPEARERLHRRIAKAYYRHLPKE